MSGEHRPIVPTFEPLSRASKPRLVLGAVIGGVVWVVALVLVAVVLDQTHAIEIGLLVAGASFVLASIVLPLLRAARLREERRYGDGR